MLLSACAPGEAQLQRFESRDDGADGVTDLDGGVEMIAPTSIAVRPVGAGRFDLEEVAVVDRRAAVTVSGTWTEDIETDDLSARVRIDLEADATPLLTVEGEGATSYEVEGTFSVHTSSVECTSHRVRTRCGLSEVVDARVTGLLSIVGDDATVRLAWTTFGTDDAAARPSVTFARWPTVGRSAPIWEHESDAVAVALEQTGYVGASLLVPNWPGDVRDLSWPSGRGSVWIDAPDR